jgi:four helix bundle protein
MSSEQNEDKRMKSVAKIARFTDLVAWQKAHKLVLAIYASTNKFPKEERFGLTSQMTRAAVSVSSNIAEGFSRDSYADKKHFYVMSHGSLTELQNQLLIARDIKFLNLDEFDRLAGLSVETIKPLIGLIKSTKERV